GSAMRPRGSRREAVRIRRGVAALEADLVRALTVVLDEEVRLHGEAAAVGLGVELDHPAADALGVELDVPARVERVGQVDALAVTADRDHLRPAVQRARRGMRSVADDAAEVDGA